MKVLVVIKSDGELMLLQQGVYEELRSPLHCIFEFSSTNESGLVSSLSKTIIQQLSAIHKSLQCTK